MGNVSERFAKRLKDIREAAGLTQDQLAKELKVSRGAISYYEKAERTPDIEFLDRVSYYFGLPLDFLLGDTDNFKEEYRYMSEIYGLSDEACSELDNDPRLGQIISLIFKHKNFPSIKRAYWDLISNYNNFDYSRFDYISYLLTKLLDQAIQDSLRTMLDLQYTPEEKDALRLKIMDLDKELDALNREMDSLFEAECGAYLEKAEKRSSETAKERERFLAALAKKINPD